jgi:hypothetical protein
VPLPAHTMSGEVDCFLSYAREDKPLAERIFIRLRRHGIRIWMDKPPQPYTSEGIVLGADWHDVIQKQIEKARLFLPLFTATAVESGSYFEHELKVALRMSAETPDRPDFIIPILSGGEVPDLSVEGRSFAAFQWIDIEADGLNALLSHLLRLQPASPDLKSADNVLTLDVATVEQLIDAVGPNRRIRLAPGDYNLSKVKEISHGFMSIEPEFDGPQIIFHNLKNTEFSCEEQEPAHLYVEPRYTYPLYLSACESIRLRNLRFGHLPEPGECIGGVIKIVGSKTIDLNECDLYGCGTLGLDLEQAENVVVSNSLIRECNQAFASIESCRDVVLHNCVLRNNAVNSGFTVANSDNVRIVNTVIRDNTKNPYYSAETPLVLSSRSTNVALEGCQIMKYPFVDVVDVAQGIEVLKCEVY